MIHDDLKNIKRYKGIIPDSTIKFIHSGKYVEQEIELKDIKDKTFELHRNNKDLFIVLKGCVKFQYAITDNYDVLDEYDETNDIMKCHTIDYNEVVLEYNEFLLLDELVLHKPNLKIFESDADTKATIAIVKIEVNE